MKYLLLFYLDCASTPLSLTTYIMISLWRRMLCVPTICVVSNVTMIKS